MDDLMGRDLDETGVVEETRHRRRTNSASTISTTTTTTTTTAATVTTVGDSEAGHKWRPSLRCCCICNCYFVEDALNTTDPDDHEQFQALQSRESLLECQSCGVIVHSSCYEFSETTLLSALETLAAHAWLCHCCTLLIETTASPAVCRPELQQTLKPQEYNCQCIACPIRGGALCVYPRCDCGDNDGDDNDASESVGAAGKKHCDGSQEPKVGTVKFIHVLCLKLVYRQPYESRYNSDLAETLSAIIDANTSTSTNYCYSRRPLNEKEGCYLCLDDNNTNNADDSDGNATYDGSLVGNFSSCWFSSAPPRARSVYGNTVNCFAADCGLYMHASCAGKNEQLVVQTIQAVAGSRPSGSIKDVSGTLLSDRSQKMFSVYCWFHIGEARRRLLLQSPSLHAGVAITTGDAMAVADSQLLPCHAADSALHVITSCIDVASELPTTPPATDIVTSHSQSDDAYDNARDSEDNADGHAVHRVHSHPQSHSRSHGHSISTELFHSHLLKRSPITLVPKIGVADKTHRGGIQDNDSDKNKNQEKQENASDGRHGKAIDRVIERGGAAASSSSAVKRKAGFTLPATNRKRATVSFVETNYTHAYSSTNSKTGRDKKKKPLKLTKLHTGSAVGKPFATTATATYDYRLTYKSNKTTTSNDHRTFREPVSVKLLHGFKVTESIKAVPVECGTIQSEMDVDCEPLLAIGAPEESDHVNALSVVETELSNQTIAVQATDAEWPYAAAAASAEPELELQMLQCIASYQHQVTLLKAQLQSAKVESHLWEARCKASEAAVSELLTVNDRLVAGPAPGYKAQFQLPKSPAAGDALVTVAHNWTKVPEGTVSHGPPCRRALSDVQGIPPAACGLFVRPISECLHKEPVVMAMARPLSSVLVPVPELVRNVTAATPGSPIFSATLVSNRGFKSLVSEFGNSSQCPSNQAAKQLVATPPLPLIPPTTTRTSEVTTNALGSKVQAGLPQAIERAPTSPLMSSSSVVADTDAARRAPTDASVTPPPLDLIIARVLTNCDPTEAAIDCCSNDLAASIPTNALQTRPRDATNLLSAALPPLPPPSTPPPTLLPQVPFDKEPEDVSDDTGPIETPPLLRAEREPETIADRHDRTVAIFNSYAGTNVSQPHVLVKRFAIPDAWRKGNGFVNTILNLADVITESESDNNNEVSAAEKSRGQHKDDAMTSESDHQSYQTAEDATDEDIVKSSFSTAYEKDQEYRQAGRPRARGRGRSRGRSRRGSAGRGGGGSGGRGDYACESQIAKHNTQSGEPAVSGSRRSRGRGRGRGRWRRGLGNKSTTESVDSLHQVPAENLQLSPHESSSLQASPTIFLPLPTPFSSASTASRAETTSPVGVQKRKDFTPVRRHPGNMSPVQVAYGCFGDDNASHGSNEKMLVVANVGPSENLSTTLSASSASSSGASKCPTAQHIGSTADSSVMSVSSKLHCPKGASQEGTIGKTCRKPAAPFVRSCCLRCNCTFKGTYDHIQHICRGIGTSRRLQNTNFQASSHHQTSPGIVTGHCTRRAVKRALAANHAEDVDLTESKTIRTQNGQSRSQYGDNDGKRLRQLSAASPTAVKQVRKDVVGNSDSGEKQLVFLRHCNSSEENRLYLQNLYQQHLKTVNTVKENIARQPSAKHSATNVCKDPAVVNAGDATFNPNTTTFTTSLFVAADTSTGSSGRRGYSHGAGGSKKACRCSHGRDKSAGDANFKAVLLISATATAQARSSPPTLRPILPKLTLFPQKPCQKRASPVEIVCTKVGCDKRFSFNRQMLNHLKKTHELPANKF